jgi:opacity protein-like surface antigen
MSRQLVVAALLILVMASAPAAAQTPGKNELTVFAGVSFTNLTGDTPPFKYQRGRFGEIGVVPLSIFRERTTLGGSAEFGTRYAYYVTDAISVNGDFSIAPGHTLTQELSFDCGPGRVCIAGVDIPPDVSLFIPNYLIERTVVAYHYGAGIGIDLMEGRIRPSILAGIGAATNDGDGITETRFTGRVGGGLSADVGRLAARVELVDIITADHFATGRAEHDLHFRVGVGVRW